jgi:uncharacterized protein YbjT (DUF2867 family)
MGEARLHVVSGTGQAGSALVAQLSGLGVAVRAVSWHRPVTLHGGIDWRATDAADPEVAADAAQGASVVYQSVNSPYTRWPERFPPLHRGGLAAAARTGALPVVLENLCGYGPAGIKPARRGRRRKGHESH